MGYSYKTYSETKDVMKKYVNATEGAIIYSMSKTHLMTLVNEAGALYKVGNSALINTEIFEEFLEKYREPARLLPKHVWEKIDAEIKKPE
jgi:hypothetical protein